MDKHLMVLIATAAVMLYVSSRAAASALGGMAGRAVGHFIPVLMAALVATWAGLEPLAINVLFASTVMTVTLVAGVSLLTAPVETEGVTRRAWGFFLPLAAIVWTIGSLGDINYRSAIALALVGGVLAWVGDSAPVAARARPQVRLRLTQMLLATIVAGMGAVFAVIAVQTVLAASRPITQGMLASTLIAPLVVLPLLGATSEMALSLGSSSQPISVCMISAILNLCAGLPAITALRAAKRFLLRSDSAVPYPLPYGTWRIDSMVLLVVGLLILPIALGRWSPSRVEGLLLVLIYVLYLYLISPLGAG